MDTAKITKRSSDRQKGDSPPKKKSRNVGAKSSCWVLTIPNPTTLERKHLWEMSEDYAKANQIIYFIVGEEVAPTTKMIHFQGFVVFSVRKQLSTVKKIFPRAHLETKSKFSTYQNNVDYCSKDGLFSIYGTLPETTQGARERENKAQQEVLAKLALEGKLDEIREIAPATFVNRLKTYQHAASYAAPIPEDRPSLCDEWIWGSTGLGKSRTARANNPRETMYIKNLTKWWDGYNQQRHTWVLIDDFPLNPPIELINNLKQWSDHYAFNVEFKGGSMMIRPPKIIITSNYSIEQCFERSQDHLPLLRRFKVTNLIQPFVQEVHEEDVDID